MNIRFHQYFNLSNIYALRNASWGMALALHERLDQLGMNPKIVVDFSLEVPAHVKVGDKLYGLYGESDISILSDNFDYVAPGDLLGHSEREGVDFEMLYQIKQGAVKLIDKAIWKSVLDMSKKGLRNAPEGLYETHLLRAKLQGYDIEKPLYHETSRNNAKFILADGFNLELTNGRGSDDGMPDGVFLKPTSAQIDVARDPVQMAFYIKQGEQISFKDRKALCDYMSKDEEFCRLHEDSKMVEELYSEIYEGFISDIKRHSGNPEKLTEIKKHVEDVKVERVNEAEKAAKPVRERITEILKSEGFSSLHVEFDEGSFGRLIETIVVFDPNDIKSIQHDFIPHKIKEKECNYDDEYALS